MNRWLARLSFSLLILSGLLIAQGWQELHRPAASKWRIGLYFLSAGIGLGLSLKGVRERHRQQNSDQGPTPP